MLSAFKSDHFAGAGKVIRFYRPFANRESQTENATLIILVSTKNIFKEGELSENSVTEEYSATASDRKKYQTANAKFQIGTRVQLIFK